MIFRIKRRKIRWGATSQKARNSIIRMSVMSLIVIILSFFIALPFGSPPYPNEYFPYWFIVGLSLFALSMTIFSLVLDVASIWIALKKIEFNDTISAYIGDVSIESRDHIFMKSLHSLARLRVARLLTFNVCIRVALLIFFYGFFVWGVIVFQDITILYKEPIAGFPLILSLPIAIFYLFEPVWRVKTIVAIGVRFSTKSKGYISRVIISIFGLICLWISQIMVLGLIYGFTGLFIMMSVVIINTVYNDGTFPDWSSTILVFILICFFPIGIREFYRIMTVLLLKKTSKSYQSGAFGDNYILPRRRPQE